MRDFNESQTYVQHLLAEHHRLHLMLQAARHEIASSINDENAKSGLRVISTLRSVRNELADHFREEEEGGCMEEAISYCPQLGLEVHRIKNEHPILLRGLDRLLVLAELAELTAGNRTELQNGFDKLCRDLHTHEAEENALLRRGFGTNVNGDEDEAPLEKGIS